MLSTKYKVKMNRKSTARDQFRDINNPEKQTHP
jgi:hypothetical protein